MFSWVAEPLKPFRTPAEFTAEVPLIGVYPNGLNAAERAPESSAA